MFLERLEKLFTPAVQANFHHVYAQTKDIRDFFGAKPFDLAKQYNGAVILRQLVEHLAVAFFTLLAVYLLFERLRRFAGPGLQILYGTFLTSHLVKRKSLAFLLE